LFKIELEAVIKMTTREHKESFSVFEELESENLRLVAISFSNGYFLGISKKEDLKLGTMAVSLPFTTHLSQSRSKQEELKGSNLLSHKDLTTTTVLGSRNEVMTKALAEKVVFATGKLVYLSANFPENDQELFTEALRLVEQFLKSRQQSIF